MIRNDSFDLWLPSAVQAAGQRLWRGQVVRHRTRGYRGVVVDWDPQCRRSAAWRACLFERPRADQPWYTLLVDGDSTSSYVAQEDLEPESTARPIRHPLLYLFFQGFGEGQYWRNDRPWPAPITPPVEAVEALERVR
jgi:heat shock protein HspQ